MRGRWSENEIGREGDRGREMGRDRGGDRGVYVGGGGRSVQLRRGGRV